MRIVTKTKKKNYLPTNDYLFRKIFGKTGNAECHTSWEVRDSKYGKNVLTSALELHIIELPKINFIFRNEISDNLLMWLRFIINPEKVEETDMARYKVVEKAKKEYEEFNEDEIERALAEVREKERLDRNSIYYDGVEKGLEQAKKEYEAELERASEELMQGKFEQKLEIAKKLLQEGMEISKICEIIELTEEEIKNIK